MLLPMVDKVSLSVSAVVKTANVNAVVVAAVAVVVAAFVVVVA